MAVRCWCCDWLLDEDNLRFRGKLSESLCLSECVVYSGAREQNTLSLQKDAAYCLDFCCLPVLAGFPHIHKILRALAQTWSDAILNFVWSLRMEVRPMCLANPSIHYLPPIGLGWSCSRFSEVIQMSAPRHIFQLQLGNPKTFPGYRRYMIQPVIQVCPWVSYQKRVPSTQEVVWSDTRTIMHRWMQLIPTSLCWVDTLGG